MGAIPGGHIMRRRFAAFFVLLMVEFAAANAAPVRLPREPLPVEPERLDLRAATGSAKPTKAPTGPSSSNPMAASPTSKTATSIKSVPGRRPAPTRSTWNSTTSTTNSAAPLPAISWTAIPPIKSACAGEPPSGALLNLNDRGDGYETHDPTRVHRACRRRCPCRPGTLASCAREAPVSLLELDLRGTTWHGKCFDIPCFITFEPNGALTYRVNKNDPNTSPGVWRLTGDQLFFEINQFSEHRGPIVNNVAQGESSNKSGMRGKFQLHRLASGE